MKGILLIECWVDKKNLTEMEAGLMPGMLAWYDENNDALAEIKSKL